MKVPSEQSEHEGSPRSDHAHIDRSVFNRTSCVIQDAQVLLSMHRSGENVHCLTFRPPNTNPIELPRHFRKGSRDSFPEGSPFGPYPWASIWGLTLVRLSVVDGGLPVASVDSHVFFQFNHVLDSRGIDKQRTQSPGSGTTRYGIFMWGVYSNDQARSLHVAI